MAPPKEVLRARLLEMLIQGDDDYGDVSDLIGRSDGASTGDYTRDERSCQGL